MSIDLDTPVRPCESVPLPGDIAGGCRRIQSRWSTDERRRRRRLAQMKRRRLSDLLSAAAMREAGRHDVQAISKTGRPIAVLEPGPPRHSGPLVA
jgi:hypothetical protein